MKLTGSKTEREFRERLILSQSSLFHPENKRVLDVLKGAFPNLNTAFPIGYTPEQDEETYVFLINADQIVVITLDRFDFEKQPKIDQITLKKYKCGLSKIFQIKLMVAIDLAMNGF